MLSVDALHPACKRPLSAHLPSARRAPEDVPPDKVAVVNGRCIVAGQRAPQKCCWVALGEPMTPEEYGDRFDAGTIALEPCPGCGGPLSAWGSFSRTLAKREAGVTEDLELRRGRCWASRSAGAPGCRGWRHPLPGLGAEPPSPEGPERVL